MKKINILFALTLSCALVFSATACTNEPAPFSVDGSGSEATTTPTETTANEPETTTTEPETDITPVKDYTSAPYYENLAAWFDCWGYTDEQFEAFLMNTETCDRLLYDDDFWATDDLSPVIMLNGDIAVNDDVVDISEQGFYTLDLCFAVPYGTAAKERTGDNWIRLEAGSEWNGLAVSETSSGYNTKYYVTEPKSLVTFQEARFTGSITLTVTRAEYFSELRGTTDVISLFIDEESRSALPSLYPYFDDRECEDDEYSEENICFTISDESEYFQQIADKIDAGEEFTATVTTDAFMLQWTDFGLMTDGITNGKFENILEFNIN